MRKSTVTQDIRKTGIRTWAISIHSFAVMALLLRFLVLLVFYTEPYYAPKWIMIAQFLTALSGMVLGKMWKRKPFWFLAAYCVYLFIRLLLENTKVARTDLSVRQILFHTAWVVGACYTLPYVLGREQMKRFLRIFAAVWTAGVTIHCFIALYAAWKGIVIWNPVHGAFWGFSGKAGGGGPGFMEVNALGSGVGVRLNVVMYCTVSGAMVSLSGMIALIAAVCEKNRWAKLAYALSLVPFIFVMGLTDTRACHISFGAGAGAVAGILLMRKLRAGSRGAECGKGRRFVRGCLSVGVALAAALVIVVIIGKTTSVFNGLKARGSLVIPAALAEGAESGTTVVSSRGFEGGLDRILSGRVYAWKYLARYLSEHPKAILWGESVWKPMRGPNAQSGLTYVVGHPHNAELMVLLQHGIPGVILMGAMMLITVRRSFRLVNHDETPLWLALVPAVALSLCVGDLVECIAVFMAHAYPNCSALFLCMGLICLYGAKDRIPGADAGGERII